MEEALRLTTQQKLQQRLTPLQVQFVRMLEMTGPELEDEVRRAVDDNPALEVADDDSTAQPENDFNESAEEMQLADYRGDDIPSYRLEANNHSSDDRYYEPVATDDGETLIGSLNAQIAQTSLSPIDREVAEYIIGNLDDNGYMTRSIQAIADDLAFQRGLDVTYDQVKAVWNTVRSLEPAGIGATDLRDSLLLQLRRRHQSAARDLAIEIVADYFDLFSKKHFDRIISLTGISEEQLREAITVIRQLNPKPGSGLQPSVSDDRTRHINPDFSVETDGDNITLTLLNATPELQIEESFASDDPIAIPDATPRQRREALLFVRQKRDEAANFIKVIKMRQETLYRVMLAIIKLQRQFFLTDDPTAIRPMILKDVAALTGYDLSVISRATAGKYVMTQRGVYPLKMFFNERPKDDDDTSSMQILAALRKIIDNEDKRHPLSDEAITAALRDEGYDIARRTVAKYREKAGVPVARLRKEI